MWTLQAFWPLASTFMNATQALRMEFFDIFGWKSTILMIAKNSRGQRAHKSLPTHCFLGTVSQQNHRFPMPPCRDVFISLYISLSIYIYVSVYLHLDCLYVLYIRGPYLTSVMMLVRDPWRREGMPGWHLPLRFSVSSWACGPSVLRFLQEWRRVTHRTTLVGLSDDTRIKIDINPEVCKE